MFFHSTGTNGGIPWKCPRDVKNFKALTNSRILIIGRKTFNEHPNLVHVNHTRFCIVVSKSLDSLDVDSSENTSLQLVRSFPEALDLARELNDEYFEKVDNSDGANSNESLICWVGGGEAIYTEAIRHPSAAELHLSVLDIEIEPTREKDVAYFPSKYRWDNVFTEASKTYYPADTEAFAPSFTYFIYKRKKPRPDHAIKL